eukprot:14860546-Alexandrium_andersonii.AAC.1
MTSGRGAPVLCPEAEIVYHRGSLPWASIERPNATFTRRPGPCPSQGTRPCRRRRCLCPRPPRGAHP